MIMSRYFVIIVGILLIFLSMPYQASAAIYNYDSLNRLTSIDYENGKKTTYTYDSGGNLLTVQPTVDSVSGQVYLEGVTKNLPSKYAGKVQIKLIDQAGYLIASTVTDYYGKYVFTKDINNNPLPADSYTVIASKPVYLTNAVKVTDDYKVPDILLLTSDLNHDNRINSSDFAILSDYYGSTSTCTDQDNWYPEADLNRNNVVDIFDLVLLFRNFGKIGYSG